MKIGDHVECTVDYYEEDRKILKGMKGKIVDFASGSTPIGVQWKTFGSGHNCGGTCPNTKGFYVPKGCIKVIPIPTEIQSVEQAIANIVSTAKGE